MHRRIAGRAFAAGAAALVAGAIPAAAQTAAPAQPPAPATAPGGGVIASPSAITDCLCGQQRIDTLKGQLDEAQRRMDEARARLDSLDRQIEQARPNVNVNRPEQVNAFRRLIEQRERAHAALYNDEQPHYAAVVQRYNSQVVNYNGLCGGKELDATVLAQVRASLVCPPMAPQ